MDGQFLTWERDFFKNATNRYIYKVQYLITDYIYTTTSEDTETLFVVRKSPFKEIRYFYGSTPRTIDYSVIEDNLYESIIVATGVTAKTISVFGDGLASNCTCESLSVSSSTNCSCKSTMADDGSFNDPVYFDFSTIFGKATNCTVNGEMEVYNGGEASGCKINGTLTVEGGGLQGNR